LNLELWIPITVLAAFSQNVRSALQKHLTSKLSTVGATQARFLYAAPFAILYVLTLHYGLEYDLPRLNPRFLLFATVGGLAQVLAAALLVALYSHRNFFVGTALSKTETIQAAILGFLILADDLSIGGIIGICVGIAGVITISAAKSRPSLSSVIESLKSKTSIIGLAVGLFFGVAAICFRGASLSLTGGYAIQAAVTLAFVLLLQTSIVWGYLVGREPGQMTAVFVNWRVSWLVGLTGMLASVGWFSAMTLENAGYVRAVGQIELVFAFLASTIVFREKTKTIEFLGIALIVVGILVLLRYR
jgi:drug/metabolite transporter (DMT)-like permease